MYRPVAARSTNASVRSTGLCQTNRSPSTMPAQTPSGSDSRSGLPVPSSRSTLIAMIDRPNADAVTHIVLIPPSVAISRPPMPGPTM